MIFSEQKKINTEKHNIELSWSYDVDIPNLIKAYPDDEYLFNMNSTTLGGTFCRISIHDKDTKLVLSSIIQSDVYSIPNFALDLKNNYMFVNLGKNLYAFSMFDGALLHEFRYEYPMEKLICDETISQIFVLAETDILCLTYDCKLVWKYSHREVITDISIQGAVVRFIDLDNQTFRISIAKGTLYNV